MRRNDLACVGAAIGCLTLVLALPVLGVFLARKAVRSPNHARTALKLTQDIWNRSGVSRRTVEMVLGKPDLALDDNYVEYQIELPEGLGTLRFEYEKGVAKKINFREPGHWAQWPGRFAVKGPLPPLEHVDIITCGPSSERPGASGDTTLVGNDDAKKE